MVFNNFPDFDAHSPALLYLFLAFNPYFWFAIAFSSFGIYTLRCLIKRGGWNFSPKFNKLEACNKLEVRKFFYTQIFYIQLKVGFRYFDAYMTNSSTI